MPRPKGFKDKSANDDARNKGPKFQLRPSIAAKVEAAAIAANVSKADWLEALVLNAVKVVAIAYEPVPFERLEWSKPDKDNGSLASTERLWLVRWHDTGRWCIANVGETKNQAEGKGLNSLRKHYNRLASY